MTMSDQKGWIWMDGTWVPWQEAKVHVLTHSLHYGMGIFEGLRAYDTDRGTAIFRLEEHTHRFIQSARALNMAMPFTEAALNAAQKEVVMRNELKTAYVRPLGFYGAEGMGIRADNLKMHVSIAAWHWGAYMGEEGLEKGIKVATAATRKLSIQSQFPKVKATGHYINSMLALSEAMRANCEEALLLDPEGYVAEGSGENIFLVKAGVLYTPMLTHCLNGITRQTIFTLAKDLGLTVREALLTREDVYLADEAFFTGTAAEITPIRMVDGRPIGNGGRGPITQKLQSLYFEIVHGRVPAYAHWCHLVS